PFDKADYTTTTATATLNVNPAPLTIAPAPGQSMVAGAAVPSLTYSPSGFVNGDSASLLSGALGTTATSASVAESYPFTLGTLNAGGNYALQLAANAPTLLVTPVVTSSTANLGKSATQITISGFGFDPTAAHNTVTFDDGAAGTVTAATATA